MCSHPLAWCMFECLPFADGMHALWSCSLITNKSPESSQCNPAIVCTCQGRVRYVVRLWLQDAWPCAAPSRRAVFLWEQVLFKEVAVPCRLLAPFVSLPYSSLHGSTQHLLRRRRTRGEGACLREGTLVAPEGFPASASPVTVLLKTCRSPNRQRQAAVFGRAAAAAAARCCLCHTARASGAGSTATTRTRGWISRRPGPPTRLSCRDSGNRELPLRLRTWKTSWRWMA